MGAPRRQERFNVLAPPLTRTGARCGPDFRDAAHWPLLRRPRPSPTASTYCLPLHISTLLQHSHVLTTGIDSARALSASERPPHQCFPHILRLTTACLLHQHTASSDTRRRSASQLPLAEAS